MKPTKSEFLELYLTELEKLHGHLTPEIVVDAARPETSPIHKYFQWDDRTAADEYRLWQARQLIAKVYVIVPDPTDDKPIKVRLFHSIGIDDDGESDAKREYLTLAKIMNDDQKRAKLLKDALRDMEFFANKYGSLTELQPIFDAMKQVKRPRKPRKQPKEKIS